jgi:tRNA/rRNA methyltransferase
MDGGRANGGGSGGAGWIDWPHFIGKVCVDPNPGFATLAAHVRFILVAPSHPGNIGAAARALKAMGFARLGVVNPRVVDFRTDPEAVALSVGAVDILAAATDHPELVAALGGVTRAYAMTGYTREFGPPLIDLRSACGEAGVHLRADELGPQVAFVFGTERSGLTNDEVALCQASCAIPADPLHGSLNLAQAVQVVAYEMRLALSAAPPSSRFVSEPPAGVEALEGMYRHLEEALIALEYLDPDVPRKLLSRLRRLLARAQPTASEIDILRGVCAAIIRRKSERAGTKSPARQRG